MVILTANPNGFPGGRVRKMGVSFECRVWIPGRNCKAFRRETLRQAKREVELAVLKWMFREHPGATWWT